MARNDEVRSIIGTVKKIRKQGNGYHYVRMDVNERTRVGVKKGDSVLVIFIGVSE